MLERIVRIRRFGGDLSGRGKIGTVPAPTQVLHQLHRRKHLIDVQRVQRYLIVEQCGLSNHYVDVGIDAGIVAVYFEIEILLRGSDGLLLLEDLLRVDARGGQRILDLQEGGEDRLPVIGEVGVVDGHVLVELGAVEPAVEENLGDGRANGPDAAGPVRDVLEESGLGSAA